MRWAGSAWRDTVPLFGAVNRSTKIFNIKYTAALNGRWSTILNATTNQKLAAATEGSMEGKFDKRDAWGKRNSIVLGALDVELKVKT